MSDEPVLTNSAFTIAFEVIHEGEVPTETQFITALISRVADLLRDPEQIPMNFDSFDTMEHDADEVAEYDIETSSEDMDTAVTGLRKAINAYRLRLLWTESTRRKKTS